MLFFFFGFENKKYPICVLTAWLNNMLIVYAVFSGLETKKSSLHVDCLME